MMRIWLGTALAAMLSAGLTGCSHLPGKPGFRAETMRPDQTHDFAILYKQNCSGCHGDRGLNGAALPLNNPVYLQWAGHDRMVQIVASGISHSLMPAFGRGGGGLLTNEQVDDIAKGMISHWGKPDVMGGLTAPGYAASSPGNAAQGKDAFQTYCVRCHGANGEGNSAVKSSAAGEIPAAGSIVDPTYLSLISNQGLRDVIVSGMSGAGMPDWRDDVAGKPMTDADVTNIVAWMISHRVPFPGQPFATSGTVGAAQSPGKSQKPATASMSVDRRSKE